MLFNGFMRLKTIKFQFFLFACLFGSVLKGQDLPTPITQPHFCKPGVPGQSRGKGLVLEYGVQFDQLISDEYREIDDDGKGKVEAFEVLKTKLKIPVIYSKGLVVLLGAKHRRESYRFDKYLLENGPIPIRKFEYTLISNSFSLDVLKPINHKYYLAFQFGTSFNGNYRQVFNFDRQYFGYRAAAVFGMKNRTDRELAFGLAYRQGIRNVMVYPFLVYNQTFNEKWGIETLLPIKIYGRYNFNPRNIFLFGAQFDSKEFFVSLDDQTSAVNDFRMNRQEIRIQCRLEKQLTSWIWFSAKAGYLFPIRHRFEEYQNFDTFYNIRPGSGPFGKIGIFLSPPTAAKPCPPKK